MRYFDEGMNVEKYILLMPIDKHTAQLLANCDFKCIALQLKHL